MVWREDYEVIVEAVQGSRRVEGGWCSEGGARAEAAGARAGQAAPVDARPPHAVLLSTHRQTQVSLYQGNKLSESSTYKVTLLTIYHCSYI